MKTFFPYVDLSVTFAVAFVNSTFAVHLVVAKSYGQSASNELLLGSIDLQWIGNVCRRCDQRTGTASFAETSTREGSY